MSLQFFLIFVVYATLSTPFLAASYKVSTSHPNDKDAPEIQLVHYLHKEDQTFDATPKERNLLFEHKALQNFSAENQRVSICFNVKNKDIFDCRFTWCAEGDHDAKAFVTLRLGNEKGAIMRKLSLYDAVRVGFLRCIKDGKIQTTPFYSPELGKAAAALIKCRRAEFSQSSLHNWISEDKLQAWEQSVCPFSPPSSIVKTGEEKVSLCYQVTSAEEWPPGVVRITVGNTALTGFSVQPQYICDDSSAFFEAMRKIQLLY